MTSPNLSSKVRTASNRKTARKQTALNFNLQFLSSGNLPLDAYSGSAAVADFNEDGNPDTVITTFGFALNSNVKLFLGTGTGTFNSAIDLQSAGDSPGGVAIADINGDGHQDILTADRGSDSVSLLLGRGDGSFSKASSFQVGSLPQAVVIGDLNQDGNLDVATANLGFGANSVSVLMGNGNGTFRSAQTVKVAGTQPIALATADLNRDNKLDLITADTGSNTVSVLLGTGNGSFRQAQRYAIGGIAPFGVVTGDFDEDGKLDIATANNGTGAGVSVLFGNGRGSFSDQTTLLTGVPTTSIRATDLNGDGHADLVATLRNAASVAVILSDGAGNFSRPFYTSTNASPTATAIGDFNQDRKPDLVVTSGTSTDALVLRNRSSLVLLTLPKNNRSGSIDGTQEISNSITVNLAKATLQINNTLNSRYTVENYVDVTGTQASDRITGSGERNSLSGEAGNDTISGLDGNDVLIGGAGTDRMDGGAGNDRLIGGISADQLTGGSGNDRFIFTGGRFNSSDRPDRILDFTRQQDRIILDRKTFTALGQKASFESVKTLNAAQVSDAVIVYVQSTGRLYYNTDGATLGFGEGGLFATLNQPQLNSRRLTARDLGVGNQ